MSDDEEIRRYQQYAEGGAGVGEVNYVDMTEDLQELGLIPEGK